jgi:phosphoglycolate phosphatase
MSSGPAPAAVEGVVFDLDGTLVDSFEGIATAANAARERFGLAPLSREAITRQVGRGLEHLLEAVLEGRPIEVGAAIFREVYARVCEEETDALPDAAPTLEALAARGVRMSVASNKPAAFSERILGRLRFRSWFDAVEGPDTAGALKPDPAMIQACLRAMGVSAHRSVYVGDMPYDAEAGARAGVRVHLVAGGAASLEALNATGRPVLARLTDLLAVVGAARSPIEEEP